MPHMCVDSTARDASQRGYRVIVAADACATRPLPAADDGEILLADTIHRATLAALQDRFADVCNVAAIQAMA